MEITMKEYGLTKFELRTLAFIYDEILKNTTEINGNKYACYDFTLYLTIEQKLAMNRCFNKFFTFRAKDPLRMNTLDSFLPSIFFISYIHHVSKFSKGGYRIQIKNDDEMHITFSKELFEKITSFVDEIKEKGIYKRVYINMYG